VSGIAFGATSASLVTNDAGAALPSTGS
jgi:hypothetical protein